MRLISSSKRPDQYLGSPSVQCVKGLLHGVQLPRPQAHDPFISSAEIKNEWDISSISPIGLRAVYRDFTFTFHHNLSQWRRILEEDKESFNSARHSVTSLEPEINFRNYTSV
jgi:hypothetical protein